MDFSLMSHLIFLLPPHSLLKKPLEPSELLPRSRGKTVLCHIGSGSEPITRLNGMPSAVTGAAPSWDCKFLFSVKLERMGYNTEEGNGPIPSYGMDFMIL